LTGLLVDTAVLTHKSRTESVLTHTRMLAVAETLVVLTIRRDPKMLPKSWANMYAKPAARSQVSHCAHFAKRI